MSLRIPGEVARLAIKDMESLERKLLRKNELYHVFKLSIRKV